MHVYYKAIVKHNAKGQTEFLAFDKLIPDGICLKSVRLEKREDGSISITGVQCLDELKAKDPYEEIPKKAQNEDIKEEEKLGPTQKIYYD